MPVLDWVQAVSKKFPAPTQVDRQMLEAAAGQSLLIRGSVRLMTGRLSTTEEIEHRREEGRKPLVG